MSKDRLIAKKIVSKHYTKYDSKNLLLRYMYLTSRKRRRAPNIFVPGLYEKFRLYFDNVYNIFLRKWLLYSCNTIVTFWPRMPVMRYLLVCRLKPELHQQLSSPCQLWVSTSFLCQRTVEQFLVACFELCSCCHPIATSDSNSRWFAFFLWHLFGKKKSIKTSLLFLVSWWNHFFYSLEFIRIWLHFVYCQQVSSVWHNFVFLTWHLFLFSFRLVALFCTFY